jgi:hypothetical protein
VKRLDQLAYTGNQNLAAPFQGTAELLRLSLDQLPVEGRHIAGQAEYRIRLCPAQPRVESPQRSPSSVLIGDDLHSLRQIPMEIGSIGNQDHLRKKILEQPRNAMDQGNPIHRYSALVHAPHAGVASAGKDQTGDGC